MQIMSVAVLAFEPIKLLGFGTLFKLFNRVFGQACATHEQISDL